MRTRNIKKQVWLNKEEATQLKKKAKKCGMNEGTLLRCLITGFVPKEKPDDRFYEVLKEMRQIGNNLNQIAKRANQIGFINEPFYMKEAKQLNELIIKIKKEFLLPSEEIKG